MQPNIMIVNPHIGLFGGAERQISELANYLTDRNYRATIFTTVACPEFKASLKEARLMETGTEQALLEKVNMYSHKFDIVNPHNHPTELFFAYPLKPKVVWQCNEPPGYVLEGKDINPMERDYVQRMVKKAVVISDFDHARFRKVYGMESIINYPGIRYDYFSQDVKVRNTLNMKGNFVITQVNYFTWTKQQDKTIEIFAKVRKEVPEAKLVLIGFNGWERRFPYVDKVHHKIEEFGLEDDVFISDYLKGDDNLRNVYRQSSVCLQPVLSQGGWATTFEGISAGVPTVVSDDFVGARLISNNKLGIISGQEVEEYANRIMQVYSDYQKYKEETLVNREWIGKNLTWNRFGEKYEQIFEEVSR